jgi:predicted regulator of Ras-like GTPase activity (Roadblock/LC7/MglB family)
MFDKPEHKSALIDTIISKDQFLKINDCLSDLAGKLSISAILLVNSAGQVISRKTSGSWTGDVTLFSTLVASCYSAAKEMAKLVKEESNFKMVLHEGKYHNVFVASVNPGFFLIVVFKTGVALGMVRLFTRKTIDHLIPLLSRRQDGRTQLGHVINQQFQSLLDQELDRSFTEITTADNKGE